MRTRQEIEAMRERAYAEQGWAEDSAGRLVQSAALADEEREARAYAEGVESGLLYALNHAGEPFPR